MRVVAVDCETFRIAPGAVAPRVVCVSFADAQTTVVVGNGEPGLPERLRALLEEPDAKLVFDNAAFDLTCIAATWPELIPSIFRALDSARVTDVKLREKLLCLATHGRVDDYETPDGNTHRLSFSLASLVLKYLGVDRSAEKTDHQGLDEWRVNYYLLDGKTTDEYPPDALEYALQDASDILQVFLMQEDARGPDGEYPYRTEFARTAFSFALRLASCWGVSVDQEVVAQVEELVRGELVPENMGLLVQEGLLRPATPPRPHSKGAKSHVEGCPRKNCACPVTMVGGTKETRDLEALRVRVLMACEVGGLPVRLTDKGRMQYRKRALKLEECGDLDLAHVSIDAEAIDALVELDAALAQYQRREMLRKLVDSQIPLLRGHAVVHGDYDYLKETGRTSSYGSNHRVPLGEPGNLYPSVNIQQVPKVLTTQGGVEVDVRRAYRPRPGRTFIDVDFTSLELVCVAQTTYDLFGRSQHRDLINAGIELHTFLGAQIAFLFGRDECALAWQDALRAEGQTDPMTACASFGAFKKAPGDENQPWRDFFKHYRTMAKPVGLGFPGGLGPEKLATAIAPQYGVKITVEEARTLKEIWLQTYPEMVDYFDWVSEQRDPYNEVVGHDDFADKPIEGYWYTSPLGMVRRGATYCAAANGKAMQTPGAEAALIGLYEVQRACYDPTAGSVLYGARPWAFIHDQVVAETTEHAGTWHEQAVELSRLLCEGASRIFTHVKVSAEPMLADVWSKSAEATFGPDGRLIPWRPKE